MADSMRHRGPDDEGIWNDPPAGIGLAQRRLSIIDLAGGRQPVFNEDRKIVTVFNGEIYNYRELREDLMARGHRVVTQSDTEVIVHSYEEWGPEAVEQWRGMFAVAIWDANQRQLVLYRDRLGKKPLYFAELGGELLFASELKGVAAAARQALEVNEQGLWDYLSMGVVHPPSTIYRNVQSLEPAEMVIVRDRRIVRRQKYWHMQMLPKSKLRAEEAVEQADTMIREAVRLRLRSDVPVGAFLSGGIDSGIGTAMAAQEYPGKLTTVTIGFEDGPFDERPLARLVAERYGTDHHEVLVRPQVVRDLPAIARAYDQPFADSSAVPTYYVAQAARQFTKVVLNGDGGDELFAGYRKLVGARLAHRLRWITKVWGRAGWRGLTRMLPVPTSYRTPYAFVHRLIRGMALDPLDRYISWTPNLMAEEEKRGLCRTTDAAGGELTGAILRSAAPSTRLVEEAMAEFAGTGPIDQMMGMDATNGLPHSLLVKMDIACMAHSLEARSPLLDHVLADTVCKYRESVKLPGYQTKPILRRLSRRYLPPPVQVAPKRGFEVPVVRWLRGELRPFCEDVVLARNGLLADIFDRAGLERLMRGDTGLDPSQWGRRAWMLLMLGMWDQHVRPKGLPSAGRAAASGG